MGKKTYLVTVARSSGSFGGLELLIGIGCSFVVSAFVCPVVTTLFLLHGLSRGDPTTILAGCVGILFCIGIFSMLYELVKKPS